jgi:hypothetical protein
LGVAGGLSLRLTGNVGKYQPGPDYLFINDHKVEFGKTFYLASGLSDITIRVMLYHFSTLR